MRGSIKAEAESETYHEGDVPRSCWEQTHRPTFFALQQYNNQQVTQDVDDGHD